MLIQRVNCNKMDCNAIIELHLLDRPRFNPLTIYWPERIYYKYSSTSSVCADESNKLYDNEETSSSQFIGLSV